MNRCVTSFRVASVVLSASRPTNMVQYGSLFAAASFRGSSARTVCQNPGPHAQCIATQSLDRPTFWQYIEGPTLSSTEGMDGPSLISKAREQRYQARSTHAGNSLTPQLSHSCPPFLATGLRSQGHSKVCNAFLICHNETQKVRSKCAVTYRASNL
jgi:hypothetical protein